MCPKCHTDTVDIVDIYIWDNVWCWTYKCTKCQNTWVYGDESILQNRGK